MNKCHISQNTYITGERFHAFVAFTFDLLSYIHKLQARGSLEICGHAVVFSCNTFALTIQPNRQGYYHMLPDGSNTSLQGDQ